jgi:hypothetical protein
MGRTVGEEQMFMTAQQKKPACWPAANHTA